MALARSRHLAVKNNTSGACPEGWLEDRRQPWSKEGFVLHPGRGTAHKERAGNVNICSRPSTRLQLQSLAGSGKKALKNSPSTVSRRLTTLRMQSQVSRVTSCVEHPVLQ